MGSIEERYRELHPKSFRLYQEALLLFPDGVTHDTRWVTPFPVYASHGQGPRKWDVDGREYVDCVMGHGALLFGHGHPAIVKAVTDQVARGTHLGASTELEVRWAQAVRRLIPSAEKVRFTSSGTEATLMALRLARAYTGKTKVVKFSDHFHGWHDYVLATPGRVPAGVPPATVGTMEVLPPNDISALEHKLDQDQDIAAVILEPTGAHMGIWPVYPPFLQELREATRSRGVVLIFDEVVTGFRTSPGGAQGRYGVAPDLTTLAKILGGGLPGGAVVGKAEVLDMIQHRGDPQWDSAGRISHPGTFNANPLSAAAGTVALDLVATTNANAHAEAMARRLKEGVSRVMANHEVPGCANGVASMVHFTLGVPHDCTGEVCPLSHRQISEAMPPRRVAAMKRSLLNAGVDTMGGRTCIVSAAHQEKDIDFTIGAFEEALTAMRKDGLL
ncbi:MAG: aspartate aminotransferase family protein [Chloroflexi bacterium]|nr:aspartate aminotransferase family protein [Chloroflexota bacterium]